MQIISSQFLYHKQTLKSFLKRIQRIQFKSLAVHVEYLLKLRHQNIEFYSDVVNRVC